MNLQLTTSWAGITIEKYFNYKNALENPNTTDFEKNLDILAILCDIDRSDLMSLPANQIVPLFDKMEFLTEHPHSATREYYDIGGRKFKFCARVQDLTAGQFIDLSNYTKDPNLTLDYLHNICAVLLLPVKQYRGRKVTREYAEKYGETPHDELSEFLYKNMTIPEAIGISNFFTLLYELFTEITKRFLAQKMTKQLTLTSKMLSKAMTESLKTGSTKNGNGSQP